MNIIFFLDVKLVKKDDKYYTTGAVNTKYLNSHKINKDDNLTVVCREETKKNYINKNLDLSSGKNIEFITIKKYNQFYDKEITKKIKEKIESSDLCYIKLPSYIGLMSYKLVNKSNKKYIVEMVACAWDSLWNYGNIRAKIVAPFVYLLNRYEVKKAKNVMYVSEKFLQKRYPNKNNNIACSDVDIQDIKEENLQKRIEKIENKGENDIYKIGLIGSLNVNYKGHETAIKAISLIQQNIDINLELHFLGAGDKEKWVKLSEKYGVKEKIFFDGTLPSGQKVYEWMDDLDIYLIPSLTEGLPRALVEAMSRACPALGTNAGGIPELIGDECIVPRKNEKELAFKIIELIKNKEKMKNIAKRNFCKSQEYERKKLEKIIRKFREGVLDEEKR